MRILLTAVVAALLNASGHAQQPQRTPDIHYVPTPTAVVDAMLTLAKITPADVVYDLGSGDGRIPIAAARKYGARGVGIELDRELVARAMENAKKAGVAGRVSFRQGDLFQTDLSEATVVTLYLSPSVNLRLRSKLMRELRPGSRVVSHRFPIGDWKPDTEVDVSGTKVYFWEIPGRAGARLRPYGWGLLLTHDSAALGASGLTGSILPILPARRQQALRDLLLECSRLFDQRIEPLEEGSELLGGEKALLGH